MLGIVDYGFYIPDYRIKVDEIARVWGKNPTEIKKSLLIEEKTVAGIDEDSLTMAYEASLMALNKHPDLIKKIGAVFVGSENHPYAVNPTSTILADYLGIEGNYLAYDTQFACKAATGALISTFGMIEGKYINYGLVCASDKATGQPHDPLEYTAGSAAASFLIGRQNLILKLINWSSYSTDTPDFWRRQGMRYPSHGGRFTGKPSYFHHIINASTQLLKKTRFKPADFDYAVFHMPNGKFPQRAAKIIGFTPKQLEQSLVIKKLGNSYTASSLMGLVSVLDQAKPGQLIFLAAFGSGAGSDAFIFQVTSAISQKRKNLAILMKNKKYIDYVTYLRYMEAI